MKKVVRLPKIGHRFTEVYDRLRVVNSNFSLEQKSRSREPHGEAQSRTGSFDGPAAANPARVRRLAVLGQSLLRLLRGRRAEIVKADIVAGQPREQFPFRDAAILRAVEAASVLVGLHGLPRR